MSLLVVAVCVQLDITLLVKVSQGHNYQTSTNKLSKGDGGSFLAIRQTRTNKLSTGHGALFLQLGKLEQTNFLRAMGSFLAHKQTSILCTVATYDYG